MPEKRNRKATTVTAPVFDRTNVFVVAGLGNPDPNFAATYHNIGRRMLERLSTPLRDAGWHTKDDFYYTKNETMVFVIPRTYMNESGSAVLHALRYFKTKPESLLVIHDDADLPSGSWKLGFGRGSAGHHGIESLIRVLRTKNFWRARIGVRGDDTREKAGTFVLKRVRRADEEAFEKVFQELNSLLTTPQT